MKGGYLKAYRRVANGGSLRPLEPLSRDHGCLFNVQLSVQILPSAAAVCDWLSRDQEVAVT